MGKVPRELVSPEDDGRPLKRTAFSPTGNLKGDWNIIVMSPEDMKKDFGKRLPLGIGLLLILCSLSGIVIYLGLREPPGTYRIFLFAAGIGSVLIYLGLTAYIGNVVLRPNSTRESRVQIRKLPRKKVLLSVEEFVKALDDPFEVKRYKNGIPCTFMLDNGIKIRTLFVWSALQPNGHVAILHRPNNWEEALELQFALDDHLVKKKVVEMKR
ncbi:MAG: hypothetical protein ACMUHY_05855 [Thermoplasmatota archaeon]